MSKKQKAELIPFYTFAEYLTPEKAATVSKTYTLAEFKKMAKVNRRCCNCENPVWRFSGLNMCFPCTTGETDANGDYELVYQP